MEPTFRIALAFFGSLDLAAFHALAQVLWATPERHVAVLRNLAGGAGLAYVFLYLLFELATEGAPEIHALLPLGPAPLETLFILLLAALSATYVAQAALERTPGLHDDHRGFVALFLVYNALAGAAVAKEAAWGALNLAFYVTAIGIHLLFNELFLLHRCPDEHTARWRVVLGAAPVVGCGLALSAGLPAGAQYVALALVAGGTITIVFQRELPAGQGLRPMAFLAGVALYAGLVFATWRF